MGHGLRIGRLAWLGIGACALLACAPSTVAASSPWAGAHLWSYTARYALTGRAAGSQVWQVRANKGGGASVVLRTAIAGQNETDTLELGGRGLSLVSAREALKAGAITLSIDAKASGGRLNENAVVNGRREHVAYAMPALTFANIALLVTVSAAAWRPGERTEVHVIVLKHAETVPVGLLAGKPVEVRTPAGRFRCLPVTISSVGGRQTAWVSVGPHPVLVRYANAATTFTLASLKP